MLNKKFLLGILVMVLVFGMMVVGCGDDSTEENEETEDTTPLAPTGLTGTADGNSVKLTWQAVENASEYSVEFRKGYGDYQAINNVTTTSYTVTDLDSNTEYDFRVAAHNAKGEKSGYSTVVSVTTSNPKTGNVSIKSFSMTHHVSTSGGTQNHGYSITVELQLSSGGLWIWESGDASTIKNKAQTWIEFTPVALPTGFTFSTTSVSISGLNTINVSYSSLVNSSPLTAPNLTVYLKQDKLSDMKGYTNITDTLTLGTPAYATSSAWVDN